MAKKQDKLTKKQEKLDLEKSKLNDQVENTSNGEDGVEEINSNKVKEKEYLLDEDLGVKITESDDKVTEQREIKKKKNRK